MRSRTDFEDEVKEDASRRSLTSAKTKRASKISDDESSYEDSVPISTIKTRYRSKCTTGFRYEVQEDARKRRLTRLRKLEIKNEQDDKNSFDLKNSVCLQENSSSYDEEDNDALEDEEDNDALEDEEDYDGLEEEEDYDGLEDEEDDDSVEDDGDYDGLEDEEDNDGPEDDEDYDDERDEEDNDGPEDEEDYDGPADEEYYDGELDEEDNDSVEEDDDGDSTNKSENTIIDSEQDMDKSEVHSPNTVSAKTKRVTKIIASDDEIGYDDSSPTSTLEAQHNTRFSTGYGDEVKDDASKQCPTMLTKSESENEQGDKSSCDLNETIHLYAHNSSDEDEDNDGAEESESEHDSLGGFIVYSHDEDEPNDADDFEVILEQIGRQNDSNLKWEFEGEMLADFGKNPELCMRAVCALYRQQTADEKASKETRYRNGRGFSQTDAFRAGELAEFLTDGDSAGDLNKTVEELKQHNSKWIKLCMALASKYSKQLFQIYQNKEDPYFLPE